MTEPNYECLHEKQIQEHSLQIKELETEITFKKEKIGELKHGMDEINKKLDELIIQSTKDDTHLELRLTSMEGDLDSVKTQLTILKEERENDKKETDKRITHYIAIVAIICTIVGLLPKFI